MNLLQTFNEEHVTEEELQQFRTRRAIRGIIFDNDNNVALLSVNNGAYYQLPGGGVEDTETYPEGVIRECKEETGCDVTVLQYIGTILEYRKQRKQCNESWGYTVRVVGEKGAPILVGDENEDEKNSTVLWTSLTQAIELMEAIPKQDNIYNRYCIERDTLFLKSISIPKK